MTQDTEQIKAKLEELKSLVNEITTELYKNATPPPGEEQQSDQKQETNEQQSEDEENSNNEQNTKSDSEQKSENS